MLKPMIVCALLSSLAAAAHAQDPLPFRVDSIQVNGSGCVGEAGSRVVVGGDDILVIFPDFTASPDRVVPRRPGASCTLLARVQVRPGFALTLGPSQLDGSASSRGGRLFLFSRLFQAGSPGQTQSYDLPAEGDFSRRDSTTLTLRNCDGGSDDSLVGVTYSILAPRPGSLIRLASAKLSISTARC